MVTPNNDCSEINEDVQQRVTMLKIWANHHPTWSLIKEGKGFQDAKTSFDSTYKNFLLSPSDSGLVNLRAAHGQVENQFNLAKGGI